MFINFPNPCLIPTELTAHKVMALRLSLLVGCLLLLNLPGNDCEKAKNQDIEEKNTFLDLYASKFYVDKSSFIKDFVTMDTDLILLTFPPKWGKTVAVDMLRSFLQMNVDENGTHVYNSPDMLTDPNLKISHHQAMPDIFTDPNLKISRHHRAFIAAHYKQDPVIHLSFRNVQGNTVESMLPSLREAIARAFDHHRYVQRVLARAAVIPQDLGKQFRSIEVKLRAYHQHRQDTFEQIRNRTVDRETLKTSLYMLAETLHGHFQKKVWILIDAYDHPIDIGQTQDLAEADAKMNYLRDLLQETFKSRQYFHKVLLSGVMRVAKLNNLHGISSVVKTDMHLNHFLDDFGLQETEVDALFAAHNLTGNLVKEAKEWYKGYGMSAHVNRVEIGVYNPYSITQFIKTKNVTNYWVQTQSVDILRNLFKSSEVEAVFLRLLSGESPKVVLEDQVFSSEELHMIHGALTAPSENAKRDLYLRYLFVAGYLTLDSEFDVEQKAAHLRIANKEIEAEVTDKLLRFYQVKYRIDECVLRRVKEEFRHVQSRLDTGRFKSALEELLFAFHKFPGSTEAALNAAVLTLKSAQRYGEAYFRRWTNVADNERGPRPSVAAVNVELRSGVALEMRFNRSVKGELSWAGESAKALWHRHAVRKVMVLGVRVLPDMKVVIEPERWEYYGGG